MNVMNIIQSLMALSGITAISFGSLWLKQHLKRSFCF
jgi:hypothetical protein